MVEGTPTGCQNRGVSHGLQAQTEDPSLCNALHSEHWAGVARAQESSSDGSILKKLEGLEQRVDKLGPPQDPHRAGMMWVEDRSQHCSDTDVVVVC
ncbi:hypothetical protein NFI96_010203 [Prochilodus magdalenae]|nr:hypothetical protein NFI96_010203 [Prochilodus magdalenae]